MKISVVIPTIRPSEPLFRFQLPSLARQTMPKDEWELILVDDFPESREQKVKEFAEENGVNIKWMRSKPSYYRTNTAIACARNTGLIYADGELCVFIDDYSWVKPQYLETMWKGYDPVRGYSLIGPVTAIEYPTEPYPEDLSTLAIKHGDTRIPVENIPFGVPVKWKKEWREHRREMWDCPAGWFYTSNASAPLDKIIEVNGFWEIADLTREEDVLMGLALERAGWKFRFFNTPESTVYHIAHGPEPANPKPRYKEVTYEQLGWKPGYVNGRLVMGLIGPGKCGLNTAPDEVQLVTRDVFNTQYPGSWGLIEHFRRNPNLKFNAEIGFDLREERMKV
jgi:glycosyltransferase involved in cell wall biosynthesis